MSTLVVPIDVAALCVGKPDVEAGAGGLAPSAEFSHLPYEDQGLAHNSGPYIGEQALASSKAFGGEVALAEGLHLHWALPDGLTHGVHEPESDTVRFPSAPNRWLVTRLIARANGSAPEPTGWVVESDRLSPSEVVSGGQVQPTVPLAPSPGQNFAYLGHVFPLAGWRETAGAKRLTPFTAIGYGEPTFAAFYPNCSSSFGFHDPLEDLHDYDPKTCRLSYHVVGWYSDPAADPLSDGEVVSGKNQFRWSFAKGATPTATVCSGVVDGVAWDREQPHLDEPSAGLTAAVAGSTAEATSALLAQEMSGGGLEPKAVEQTLNALQFGLLAKDGKVDALAEFEQAVHAAGFGSLQGGVLWTVAPKGAGEGEEVTLPDSTAAELNALNRAQADVEALRRELRSQRSQLFFDWYKRLLAEYDSTDVPPGIAGQLEEIRKLLRDEVEAITTQEGRIAAAEGSIGAAAAALRRHLDSSLILSPSRAAPRYYQPNDPVLVLSGEDVKPSRRYGGDGASSPDGCLPCRLDDEVVSAVSLATGAVPGFGPAQVTAAELPGLAPTPASGPAALLAALLAEAILLSPSLQPVVAVAAHPPAAAFPATVAALRKAATAFLAGGTTTLVPYRGTAPDAIFLAPWERTPWLPIVLQYDVELRPLQYIEPACAYPSDFIEDQFELAPAGVELEFTGGGVQQEVQQYSGSVVLTPGATVDLAGEVARYLESTGVADPELEDVVKELHRLPLLSQGLGGVREATLMRGLTLQMPVADPLAPEPQTKLIEAVASAVGGCNGVAPLPEESFNPIRSGAFRLGSLRLVDAFGRFKDYGSPRVVVANGISPPPSLHLPSEEAFLPPRISQPSRLLFRWLSGDDDQVGTSSHPATSPIFGWVVPNYLDNSFAIYDAAGTPMGEIGLGWDAAAAVFTPAPGGPFPPGTGIEEVFARANPHLRDFAVGVFDGGSASFLAPFYETVRQALASAMPASFAENAAEALLLGRPLILARASLALDLCGPAASDESWTAFGAVLEGKDPGCAGLTDIRFPVELGALTRLEDTLVGYWIDAGGGSADFRSFYSPAASELPQGGVSRPTQETLTLTPCTDGSGKTVTVLMDPRGSVHATTGILPLKAIDVPRDQYAAALAAISASFAVRPLLYGANAGGPAAAQPKVIAGDWSWVQATTAGWSAQALEREPPAHAALDYSPQKILEGWLTLARAAAPPSSNPDKEKPQ